VRWIRRRVWYLASIAIGLAAVVVDLRAKSLVGAGVSKIAAATQAIADGAAREVVAGLKDQGAAQVDRGANMGLIAFLVAVASALCFFVSRRRSEPGPRIAPIAVWIVYFFLSLLAV
jgi:hypothetical protein